MSLSVAPVKKNIHETTDYIWIHGYAPEFRGYQLSMIAKHIMCQAQYLLKDIDKWNQNI